MHYCFITYGIVSTNPAYLRARGLGKALIKRGVKVTYIVDDYPENRKDTGFDNKACIVYILNHTTIGQIQARYRMLAKMKPDYVHVLNPSIKNILAVVANSKIKVIADWDEPLITKPSNFIKRIFVNLLDKWMRQRANLRIVCTKYLKDVFEQYYRCNFLYLPHATYLEQFSDGDSPFLEPTAVYMGNFYNLWDHDILFSAIQILASEGYRPRFQFIGHGPDFEKWKKWIELNKLDNIELTGYLSGRDLWLRLRHAHILLFPIRDTIVNKGRCPSKTYAYAQARRPIITNYVGEIPFILNDSAIYIDCTARNFANEIRRTMKIHQLSDVDYKIERHNYDARVSILLNQLNTMHLCTHDDLKGEFDIEHQYK